MDHVEEIEDIEVVEANMNEVINHFKTNSSVAFSHSISADFDDRRQMSAGVAVVFRRQFGRPTATDCIDEKLTYQQVLSGASVYGLVTKARYFNKPSPQTYDAAFKVFLEAFKSRNLKYLLCSPMGCVRDLIHLKQFTKI